MSGDFTHSKRGVSGSVNSDGQQGLEVFYSLRVCLIFG